jgi:hypothetical protein
MKRRFTGGYNELGFLRAKKRAIEFVEVIDALASFQYGVPRSVEMIS